MPLLKAGCRKSVGWNAERAAFLYLAKLEFFKIGVIFRPHSRFSRMKCRKIPGRPKDRRSPLYFQTNRGRPCYLACLKCRFFVIS